MPPSAVHHGSLVHTVANTGTKMQTNRSSNDARMSEWATTAVTNTLQGTIMAICDWTNLMCAKSAVCPFEMSG